MYFENGLLVLLDLLVAFVISLHALLFWCFTILNKTKQNPPIYCIECIISSAFSNKILNLRFLSYPVVELDAFCGVGLLHGVLQRLAWLNKAALSRVFVAE